MAHDDPFAQPPSDKTLIIPSPGARAARAAAAQGAQPASTHFERVDLATLDWESGLNPLVAAANPLLNLVPQFRQAHHPDPQGLRETLARAIGVFEQKAQAHGPELAGLAGKLQDVIHELLRNGLRNQALHQPPLHIGLQTAKTGKGREHRQQHGKKRHDGQQRGVGQAAGRQPQLILGKALAQRTQGVVP